MYLVVAEVRTPGLERRASEIAAAMTALTLPRDPADPVQHVRVRVSDHGADIALFLLAGDREEAHTLALRAVRAAVSDGPEGAVVRLSAPHHGPPQGLPGP
ncbi:hypothetical protein ACI2LO_16460 [Streptomyces sp. NPDC033754]|uniref:hypothetical protein n=1 Tax=unclassified Streptomyces TaxID=2593676 RepID=UPI0033D24393